jgi:F0F1-type ATP synthase membrane subunit b/b'
MPQFDTSVYASQIFWLVVCLACLVLFCKKIFIPKMNKMIARRDNYIQKQVQIYEKLEAEIEEIKRETERIRIESGDEVSGIVRRASKKSEATMAEQIAAIDKENEDMMNGIKYRLREELQSIESVFKSQIEINSELIFNKIYNSRGPSK